MHAIVHRHLPGGRLAALGLLVLLTPLFMSCRSPQPETGRGADPADEILVAASIQPLADFASFIGGARVRVRTIVPAAANPHTFDLTTEILSDVSKADLLVLNGAGLEFWAEKLISAAKNPRMRTVRTSEGLKLLHDKGHGANPHVWLVPSLAVRAARWIGDGLAAVDSLHAPEYRARTRQLCDSLEALDASIRSRVATWRSKAFIAHHATWDYFAAHYGLRQAATIEKHPGREVSPRELGDIVRLMKADRIGAVFAETLSPVTAAEMLCAETGARLAILDPLGGPATARGYFALMEWNLRRMEDVLK